MRIRRVSWLVASAVIAVAAATVHGRPRSVAPAAEPLTVLVGVTDESGRPIPDLSKDDVEVRSEGRPIAVDSLDAGPGPIDVVLLFDVTESGYPRIFSSKFLKEFLATAVPAVIAPAFARGDVVRIGTFGRETHISDPVGVDPKVLANVLEIALTPPAAMRSGPSPIWDAVDAAMSAFDRGPRRRAVILMTDGRVTGSRLGLFDVVPRALSSGALVDVISFGGDVTIPQGSPFGAFGPASRPSPAVVVRSDVYVKYLSEQSGGLFRTNGSSTRPPITVSGGGGLMTVSMGDFALPSPGPLFAQMLSGLRQMYSLGIIPAAADGQRHPLEVRVRRPGAQVQAPRAYLAPKDTP